MSAKWHPMLPINERARSFDKLTLDEQDEVRRDNASWTENEIRASLWEHVDCDPPAAPVDEPTAIDISHIDPHASQREADYLRRSIHAERQLATEREERRKDLAALEAVGVKKPTIPNPSDQQRICFCAGWASMPCIDQPQCVAARARLANKETP